MPTLNINITQEMADFVQAELSSGDYASASELVRDALRALRRDRELEDQKLEALRKRLEIGIAQAKAGEFSTLSVQDIAAAVLAETEE
jgi:antitoxin ParD1/3/4